MADEGRVGQDSRMAETTGIRRTQGSPRAAANVAEARRLVGFERHYRCGSCGRERRSWTRLAACADCGETFVRAVIHRAALAS
jgi:hypothetical protein